MEAKLINLVEGYPQIYNKFLLGYRIPEEKQKIWEKISLQMGMSPDACLKMWTRVRERYTKLRRKTNSSSDSGAVATTQWPLFDLLSFLNPHIIPRPSRSTGNKYNNTQPNVSKRELRPRYSTPARCNGNEKSIQPVPAASPYAATVSHSQSQFSQFSSPSPPLLSESPSSFRQISPHTPSPVISSPSHTPSRSSQNKRRRYEDAILTAANNFNRLANKCNGDNALFFSFGDMLAHKLIKLKCPTKQAIAMQKIFNLITEIELEK